MPGSRVLVALVAGSLALTAIACQQWDRLERPERSTSAPAAPSAGDGAPRLTNAIAVERIGRIESAQGEARIALIDDFLAEFPRAQMIVEVHALRGDALLAIDRPSAAVQAFERAIALSGTDILGLPLDAGLPLQLGTALLRDGRTEDGIGWLVRASLVDREGRSVEALRWVHAEQDDTGVPFETWLDAERDARAVVVPDFVLPGFQTESLRFSESRGRVTMVNFWSPT